MTFSGHDDSTINIVLGLLLLLLLLLLTMPKTVDGDQVHSKVWVTISWLVTLTALCVELSRGRRACCTRTDTSAPPTCTADFSEVNSRWQYHFQVCLSVCLSVSVCLSG